MKYEHGFLLHECTGQCPPVDITTTPYSIGLPIHEDYDISIVGPWNERLILDGPMYVKKGGSSRKECRISIQMLVWLLHGLPLVISSEALPV